MNPGGYAWWYLDALSDDGVFGITIIGFIGSVFSPYYKKSGRSNPLDHCALNVALYGPRGARWAMTEHGSDYVSRTDHALRIANSDYQWDGTRLTISIDELSTPLKRRIRGKVVVDTEGLGNTTFLIDSRGRHRWRPLAPLCRVTASFDEPDLRWSGDGYFDCNEGDEALEDGFTFWDWSRTIIDKKQTAILYNTDMVDGASCLSAFLVDRIGSIEEIELPPPAELPRTTIWRVRRRTRAEDGPEPKVVKTLEDTPFYSRSVIETQLFGRRRHAIHESLSGPRLNSPAVQFMLPYRMPRKD